MKVAEVVQGSDEWRQLRCGKVTSSRLAAVLAKLKRGSGEASTRRDLRTEIALEILKGIPTEEEDRYVSAAMRRGNELESEARESYENRHDFFVDTVGFVYHPTIERAGASPDGLIGTDGALEIKCPKSSTHFDYILSGKVPSEYKPQMRWVINCAGRKWCDFVSYDPRMPEHLQLFVVRYVPTLEELRSDEKEVIKFLAEVDVMISKLPKAKSQDALSQYLR